MAPLSPATISPGESEPWPGFTVCEDDISDTSSSGGISAGGTGTISSGAAAPHAEQRAADEARVNTVVKEALLKNGVDGHVIANILGRLTATQ